MGGAEAAHVGAVIECFVLIGSDSTNDGTAGKATTHTQFQFEIQTATRDYLAELCVCDCNSQFAI